MKFGRKYGNVFKGKTGHLSVVICFKRFYLLDPVSLLGSNIVEVFSTTSSGPILMKLCTLIGFP